jgi:hypothetical protein
MPTFGGKLRAGAQADCAYTVFWTTRSPCSMVGSEILHLIHCPVCDDAEAAA